MVMFTDVPTPEEMACCDAAALALGFPEDALMENAACAAMACLRRRIPSCACGLRGMRVLLLAGGGNNGGDAFCMARHFYDAGARPAVVLSRPPAAGGAAARWLDVLRRMPVPIVPAGEWLGGTAQLLDGMRPDLIVDGLMGTGLRGQLRETECRIIRKALEWKRLGAHVFAIDIPSGMNGMSGRPSPIALAADATAAFHAPKPGLLMPDAAAFTGILEVCSIGMPRAAAARARASFRTWLLPDQERSAASGSWLVCRGAASPGSGDDLLARSACAAPAPSHKGEAGKVLVIGGCRAYAGAPCLSALGAFRAGAGLVTVAGPDPVPAALRAACPAAISAVLPDRSGGKGWLASDADVLLPAMLRADAVVLGPGLGRGGEEERLVELLVSAPERPPMVIDADALFAVGRRPEALRHLQAGDILTPHPGEAAALLGSSSREVQADRTGALLRLTGLCPSVCVLKGEGTLIGRRGEASVISPWRVPQLAVAGSGDVLSGIAAALLAQHRDAVEAAAIAVWTHALAGMRIAPSFPMRGNTPQDIADAVPHALAAACA